MVVSTLPEGSGGLTAFHSTSCQKLKHALQVQPVVDANYKFVYASAGIQGVSDAGVFAQSDLRVAMDKGLLHVHPDDPLPNADDIMPYMFICDWDHALRTDLMKPYPF